MFNRITTSVGKIESLIILKNKCCSDFRCPPHLSHTAVAAASSAIQPKPKVKVSKTEFAKIGKAFVKACHHQCGNFEKMSSADVVDKIIVKTACQAGIRSDRMSKISGWKVIPHMKISE